MIESDSSASLSDFIALYNININDYVLSDGSFNEELYRDTTSKLLKIQSANDDRFLNAVYTIFGSMLSYKRLYCAQKKLTESIVNSHNDKN